jgi:hypothetical protein
VVLALAAAVVLVVLAKLGARLYRDEAMWALAGWTMPGDFGVFLRASEDVLHGTNPYPAPSESIEPPLAPYAYPPFLALAIAPFTLLPVSVAQTSWTLFGIGAIVAALLVLDVRDWRCHAVALLNPFTRDALEYGALGPVLLLLIAVSWRYRDRVWPPAACLGASIVLKLFLAPFLLWLAMTRRIGAAVLGGVLAVAVLVLSWAAIGLDGLGDYPGLLRRLTDLEAENSYSAFALLQALGLPSAAARAAAVLGGLALLVLAYRAARSSATADERDRRSLLLMLAAVLVLTPILWLHYLVLLLVPLALTRPRLSALWLVLLVPTVFLWLGWYEGWAAGSLRALVSVAATAAVVLAGCLLGRGARLPARAATGAA